MRVHFQDNMFDITCDPTDEIEVTIREDKKVLWVNANGKCLVRICQIPILTVGYPK